MSGSRRILLAVAGLVGITVAGTVGYALVVGLSWVDALYMTVITISTVGYGEVEPLTSGGKLFTVGLIVSAVGTAIYLITTGSDPENVFITLSAREANPRLRIHARAESETAIRRLRQAGAHKILSVYQAGGQRMAASILGT